MSNNHYLMRKAADHQTWLNIGADIGFQRAVDFISIVISDPDIVGEDKVYDRDMIANVVETAIKLDAEFGQAFQKGVEQDVYQTHLDEYLMKIFGDNFASFYERYPAIKRITYGK